MTEETTTTVNGLEIKPLANLTGVNLRGANLREAKYSDATTWPEWPTALGMVKA